jgi:hypothetical protein
MVTLTSLYKRQNTKSQNKIKNGQKSEICDVYNSAHH